MPSTYPFPTSTPVAGRPTNIPGGTAGGDEDPVTELPEKVDQKIDCNGMNMANDGKMMGTYGKLIDYSKECKTHLQLLFFLVSCLHPFCVVYTSYK
jgi:hypothetical protein